MTSKIKQTVAIIFGYKSTSVIAITLGVALGILYPNIANAQSSGSAEALCRSAMASHSEAQIRRAVKAYPYVSTPCSRSLNIRRRLSGTDEPFSGTPNGNDIDEDAEQGAARGAAQSAPSGGRGVSF